MSTKRTRKVEVPEQSDSELAEQITTTLLRVINKIQLGRRTARTYADGISLSLVEAEMCALIGRRDGITGGEISTELGVTPSATSQVISKLKEKGFVSDEADVVDAKRKRLHLTEQGQNAADIAQQYLVVMSESLFGDSREELEVCWRFVTRLEAFHNEMAGRAD